MRRLGDDMKILKERPLGIALAALLCGFSLFASFPILVKILSFVGVGILLSLAFLPPLREKRRRIVLLCSLLMAGILLSLFYFDYLLPIDRRYTGTHLVEGEILSVEEKEYDRVLKIRTKKIDGSPERCTVRADLYKSDEFENFTVDELREGDRLVFTASFSAFGGSTSGFDFNDYYQAEGYSAAADIRQISSVDHTGSLSLAVRIAKFRESLSDAFEERAGSEAGGFLSAVLLGERGRMEDGMRLDFRRIGIAHILALSGMHLSILAGFLEKLLLLFRIKKRPRRLLIALFAFLFMAVTGFSPSVVRAGIMLIIACLLFVLGYRQDSFTSLMIAATVILLITPYAAKETGLWLSVFACFGMIFAADTLSRENSAEEDMIVQGQKISLGRKVIRAVRSSLIFSLFAILATMVFAVGTFGNVSILSPFTTPIFGLFIELYLLLGTATLLLGWFLPVGKLLPFLYRPIRDLTAILSDIPDVYASASSPLCTAIAVASLILLLLGAILGIRNAKRAVPLFCALAVAFLGVAYAQTVIRRNTEHLLYCNDAASGGDHDCFVLTTAGKTALIDCTSPSSGGVYFAAATLKEESLTACDVYVFTAYSAGIAPAVRNLCKEVRTKTVCLPFPKSADEVSLSAEAYSAATACGADVRFYKEKEPLLFDLYSVVEIRRYPYGEGKGVFLAFYIEEQIVGYIPAGGLDGDEKSVADLLIGETDTLIFGCHGKAEYYHKLDHGAKLRRLIIEDGHIAVSDELWEKCEVEYAVSRAEIR